MKCVKGRTFSEVYIRKKHDLGDNVQCELTPHWTDCCFGEAKQLYHGSFRLSRKRLFALQRRYDS